MVSLIDTGPFSPCPAPFNMAAHVLNAGLNTPDKTALMVLSPQNADVWSFDDLRRAVLGTATGLRQTGLCSGDVVLMRLGNTVDFPIAYLAALAVGLIPVPTSSALTVNETAYIIETLKPKAVLIDPAVACPPFRNTIALSQLQVFRDLPPSEFQMGDPDRLGYIIFTSGTAGKPQAVAHAHRAIWARQMMFAGWYGLRPTDRVMHAGAFNWTYTLGTGLMDPWTIGATALIPAQGTPPEMLPDLMHHHRASIFAAAPGIYRQILDRRDPIALPDLRHGLSAGEKLPPATSDRWYSSYATPIFEAYGLSECSTFISQRAGKPNSSGTLGYPQPGRRVAILSNGSPVRTGQEGTIAISRSDPGLMLGYYGDREASQAKMNGEWFLTGDQACMDEHGAITYLGRNDDIMNAGGFRVSPIEVETVLAKMPGITAVAATCIEVKNKTEVIAAFYTGPSALDETHLRAYVTDKLARYKQPRVFIHLPELPKGANGKILRRALRTHYERPK
ncbi:MAG: class I adenylate-forming enzyme family protein [Roseobacter sp.]